VVEPLGWPFCSCGGVCDPRALSSVDNDAVRLECPRSAPPRHYSCTELREVMTMEQKLSFSFKSLFRMKRLLYFLFLVLHCFLEFED
jgi:hypothetical protein